MLKSNCLTRYISIIFYVFMEPEGDIRNRE